MGLNAEALNAEALRDFPESAKRRCEVSSWCKEKAENNYAKHQKDIPALHQQKGQERQSQRQDRDRKKRPEKLEQK